MFYIHTVALAPVANSGLLPSEVQMCVYRKTTVVNGDSVFKNKVKQKGAELMTSPRSLVLCCCKHGPVDITHLSTAFSLTSDLCV